MSMTIEDVGRVRTSATDGKLRRYTLSGTPDTTAYVADGSRSTSPHAVGASYVLATDPTATADANPAMWPSVVAQLVAQIIG